MVQVPENKTYRPSICETVRAVSESRNPQPALGAAIRELRGEREATQQDTAQAAGITVAHLSKIERGRTNPTWGTVAAVAQALGVSITEVAGRAERSRP
jgi:transcriptional regulator with XRE-family HTH domain